MKNLNKAIIKCNDLRAFSLGTVNSDLSNLKVNMFAICMKSLIENDNK